MFEQVHVTKGQHCNCNDLMFISAPLQSIRGAKSRHTRPSDSEPASKDPVAGTSALLLALMSLSPTIPCEWQPPRRPPMDAKPKWWSHPSGAHSSVSRVSLPHRTKWHWPSPAHSLMRFSSMLIRFNLPGICRTGSGFRVHGSQPAPLPTRRKMWSGSKR